MEADRRMGTFEVGVAVVLADEPAEGSDGERNGAVPGYEDASGLKVRGKHAADRPPTLVVKGEEAVRVATEAIAGQIGLAAERIALAIEAQALAAPEPGKLGLESVDVSFGITLTAGVQALFTAQGESSAQVTITLARRPDPSA